MIISKYVKIGERGQIVIPKEIRDRENLMPNQAVKIVHTDGEIIIRMPTAKESPEEAILKTLRSTGLTMKDWEEIKKERHMER